MGKYRLLALDLDGTLLNDRQEISPANLEWVRRASEAGVTVCVSTGRGFPSALPIAEQMALSTPMITVNGGEIWRKPHELHRRTLLEAEKVMKLHMLAERYPEMWFWAYSTQDIYNKEKWVGDTYAHDWLKFGYYTEDREALAEVLSEISVWEGLELSNSSPFNIEINPIGVSKATAIAEVCKMIGCDLSEAVAVGDSLNDLAAIKAVGLGVAMGNAQEAVKAQADAITASNQEDGVALVIQNYVLKA
ncbi:Cof-type HAD-IIB family hydrolase [Cohnella nanjingensis]|uniref:HAD family phosphatase n=1 Tax=Cohnella nanjingensis TaxID=1387779 RepID=A0A7X0RNR4_9BACL|nr:Cof-type HAD-IIB family hydrolase [Cohnella nanjingensis]MBB6670917.1 HAD family phosphatase [Cohnella nanjingensis]